MYFLIPALLFIYNYWSFTSSPLKDVLSPLVTFFFIDKSNNKWINIWLLVDTIADFLMDKNSLRLPIILFSIGHLIKQFAFIKSFSIFTTLILIITMFFILIVVFFEKYTIIGYVIVIITSCIHVCFLNNNAILGYGLFCLSDLMIAVELGGLCVRPRQLRVIGVPVLYWIGQYMLIIC